MATTIPDEYPKVFNLESMVFTYSAWYWIIPVSLIPTSRMGLAKTFRETPH